MNIVANRALAALLGVSALVGCAADSADDDHTGASPAEATPVASSEAKLLAEVKLANGGKVEFLQAAEGVVLINETGFEGAARQPEPGEEVLDAAELYEHLSGNPAPAELVALAKETGPLTDATSTPAAGIDKGTGWIDRVSFRASFCRPTDRYYERLHVNFITYIVDGGLNYMASAALGVEGTVLHKVGIGQSITYNELPSGKYSSYRAKANRRGTAMLSRVDEVDSDERYDHCVNYHY